MMEAALNGPFGRTILEPTVLTIGSTSDNRLVISNYSISSHHAEIRPEERGYYISDLGSAHGTYVNDYRLDWNVPYLLNPGDTILIGDTKFTYEMRDTPQATSALPGFAPSGELPGTLPAQGRPAKASRRKLWIALGSIGVAVLLLAGILVFFFVLRSTPDRTLDAFCNSVRSGDYQTAYSQFSPALQRAQSESQFAGENKLTSCTHTSANQSGGTATANLTTISSSGTTLRGIITLVQDNSNNWKISALPSTPSITLDAFCNALKARDYHLAYNQLSSRIQGQTSESDFASSLDQSRIDSCTHDLPEESGTAATGSITFVSTSGQLAVSIVTLVKEGNIWKIDGLS